MKRYIEQMTVLRGSIGKLMKHFATRFAEMAKCIIRAIPKVLFMKDA